MRDVLPFVDLFLPNEQEAMGISGAPDLPTAVGTLRTTGRTVVVKRGAAGVLLAAGQTTVAAPGFPMRALDTTGAGDSFNAGFVFQFLQGAGWDKCVTWGNACGALSTQALGGTEGFPHPAAVERFLTERAAEADAIKKAFLSMRAPA
jgi:sugar/nucleoside kinase (ribokinase family)